jgi:DNA-directed RNA polymerase subunit RPC12/RpoP
MTYTQTSENYDQACADCGDIFSTGDTVHVLNSGRRVCRACKHKRIVRNAKARAIREAYADAGMHRVRGALGGIYYE